MSAKNERTLTQVLKLRKRLESTVSRLEEEQKEFQDVLGLIRGKETRRPCVWAVIFISTAIFFWWVASLSAPTEKVLVY
jgi:hypothetical protein